MQAGWNYIVISICVLVSVFAIYKELRRTNRTHLGLRLLSSLVAITALACIALPITYGGDDSESTGNNVILITAGVHPDSLKSYLKDRQYIIDPSLQKLFPKAKLTNITALTTDTPAIGLLHVFGYGLDQPELDELDGIKIVFHPSPAPTGITAVSWTDHLKTGEKAQVQGSFRNGSTKPVKLVLAGLNTGLDSVTIAAGATANFDLSAKLKHVGRASLHLYALAAKDTINTETLPLEIVQAQQVSVLMLSASPDFETKFLKNWLSGNSYAVASRAAISKEKNSQEFINMSKLDLARLSSAQLDKFDVVIGDLSVLKSLSAAESNALKLEVAQKGPGLIVRADSSGKASSWLETDFPIERQSVKTAVPSALVLAGAKNKTAKLNIDPAYLSFRPSTQIFITDEHNHPVASGAQVGAGKLIFITLNNTYSWMLGGNRDDYTALWTLLLNKAGKKMPDTERWSINEGIATIGQPVALHLEKSSGLNQIMANQITLNPAQNPTVPFEWISTYRPEQAGWQQITDASGAASWWYTWQNSDWRSIKAWRNRSATDRYIAAHDQATSVTKQIQQKHRHPVPKIIFYILFLVACTYLWMENKFA